LKVQVKQVKAVFKYNVVLSFIDHKEQLTTIGGTVSCVKLSYRIRYKGNFLPGGVAEYVKIGCCVDRH
jgi:hypothetical protein